MLDFLPTSLKGIMSFLIYFINTLSLCLFVFLVALLKLIIPIPFFTKICNKILMFIATSWISINSFNSDLFSRIHWDVRGMENIKQKDWYLVISNHQAWTDILVLQKIFNRKIPMLKFFLKKELIWVPVLGIAWWALDFPFMKRYSKKFIRENPHLKGKDIEITKKACKKFKTIPVSIMNFIEGTRYTKAKHKLQKSKYNNLLMPKAGGIGLVLSAMDDMIKKIINVTIVYPDKTNTFWSFISGQVKHIIIDVEIIPVTKNLTGDHFNDIEFRNNFHIWLNELWKNKNKKIEDLIHASK
ncbi:MAG: acyltransferase [Desulfobacteraceae bacterium 4572_130]|nr:MAG: acyltransferase [Desulfobacteraceae bacterium 4572_130]